jgi:hypothetical protein
MDILCSSSSVDEVMLRIECDFRRSQTQSNPSQNCDFTVLPSFSSVSYFGKAADFAPFDIAGE